MGIYEHVQYTTLPDNKLQRVTTVPGLTITEVFVLASRLENRITCYCCSCDDHFRDPHCRNHGWVEARPCELHKMAGEQDEAGNIPESVQVVNQRHREARKRS